MVEGRQTQRNERTEDTPVGAAAGPLAPGQHWRVARLREVTPRLRRGEWLEALSRELGVDLTGWTREGTGRMPASMRSCGSAHALDVV